MFALLILLMGLASGFLSGLVGLGGGILAAPLLLYVPGAVGLDELAVKEVTGLTMVQGLAGALSGLTRHQSYGFVYWRLVGYMGISVAVAALAGALFSKVVPDKSILAVFAIMALIASSLIFLPGRREENDLEIPDQITFYAPLAVSLAAVIGFAGGLVGQAGSFILIPTMVYVLRIPTRIAIGSNLGIILLAATAGLAGKLLAAQVPLLLALALVGGAVPGAQVGALLGRRIQPRTLRHILALIVALATIRIWIDVLG